MTEMSLMLPTWHARNMVNKADSSQLSLPPNCAVQIRAEGVDKGAKVLSAKVEMERNTQAHM